MPGKYSPVVKRAATAITQSTRNKLGRHLWCIFTDDEMTQNAVMEYLAKIADTSTLSTHIMYSGKKIPVILVPFDVVMFLKNNKARSNYKYTPYHKEPTKTHWTIWKEGNKTPPEILRNNNHLFIKPGGKGPLSNQIRHIAPNISFQSFSFKVTDEFKSIAVISFCFLERERP